VVFDYAVVGGHPVDRHREPIVVPVERFFGYGDVRRQIARRRERQRRPRQNVRGERRHERFADARASRRVLLVPSIPVHLREPNSVGGSGDGSDGGSDGGSGDDSDGMCDGGSGGGSTR